MHVLFTEDQKSILMLLLKTVFYQAVIVTPVPFLY